MILLYRGKSFVSWRIRMATLSQYSHAAWLKTDCCSRIEMRAAAGQPIAWKKHAEELIARGCIEAWHIGDGVRETNDLREGHKKGTVIDVYDLPTLDEWKFTLIEESLRAHLGQKYWFKGILYARFNRFLNHEPPTNAKGHITAWFCSHIIEHVLRSYGHSTTDDRFPAHSIWPGSLARSIRTRYLGSITI